MGAVLILLLANPTEAAASGSKPTPMAAAATPPVSSETTTKTGTDVASSPRISCAFPRGTCGFVDGAGRVLIQPDYDWIEPFDRDLARVKSAGMYGVMDRFGRLVVPARWDYISRFTNGTAIAMAAGRYGALDRHGQEVVPAKYAGAIQIADGLFLVDASPPDPAADGGRLEAEEEKISPARTMSGRWGLIAAPDTWTIQPRFREIRPFADWNSGAPFWAKPTHKWQLVSKRGDLLTGAVFDQVEPAIGGIAIVRTANRWNVVDASGKNLLPPDVETVRRRPDGLVAYQHKGRIGAIGRDGTVNVPPSFDKIGPFINDRASAMRNGVRMWIDVNGEPSSPLPSPPVTTQEEPTKVRTTKGRVMACSDGLSLKLGPGGWTFVDRKQKQAIAGSFTAARCFVRGTALVIPTRTTQWVRIDRKGATLGTAPSCQLPDYASDHAGTVGRQPSCSPLQASSDAPTGARRGGGP